MCTLLGNYMNKWCVDYFLSGHCDILAQGLIGLIEYSYHQGIPFF
jgi:hypothetical protein